MIKVTTKVTGCPVYNTEITYEKYEEFLEAVKKWSEESSIKWTIAYEGDVTVVSTDGVEIRMEDEE